MRSNTKGFSLAELVVGIVIFGVISASALGFLVASTNTYGSLSANMNMRMEAQLAVNQISEYLIDCNSGVYWYDSTKSLCVLRTDGGSTTAHVFELNCESGELLYGKGEAVYRNGAYEYSVSPADLLVDNAVGFDVALISNDGEGISCAVIELKLETRGKTHTEERAIALRNKPEGKNIV